MSLELVISLYKWLFKKKKIFNLTTNDRQSMFEGVASLSESAHDPFKTHGITGICRFTFNIPWPCTL